MKKNKNIEMRIYELLGVKTFRKMVFVFRDFLSTPLLFKIPKEERKKYLYYKASNYNLGKVKSIEDIKKFKTQIFSNASLHIITFLLLAPNLIEIIGGTTSLLPIIVVPLAEIINIYCIMLQRYNCIRINQTIKMMAPKYEKEKDEIKNKIRKEDSLLIDHTYKIVDKKERETSISFEELIANANIEQLRDYYEYLVNFQRVNQLIKEKEYFSTKHQVAFSIPMENHKTLKLELKLNKPKTSLSNNE